MVALKKPKPRAPLAAKPSKDVTLDAALETVNEYYAKTLAYLGK